MFLSPIITISFVFILAILSFAVKSYTWKIPFKMSRKHAYKHNRKNADNRADYITDNLAREYNYVNDVIECRADYCGERVNTLAQNERNVVKTNIADHTASNGTYNAH